MGSEITWQALALRLGVSVLLGGAIGIEREIHGKTAGLRTHTLVALGSALFTVISFAMPQMLGATNSDPTRIAAQILTGVGFLGAGTIMQARGSVHGLTTAASIWLVAAIGMAAGTGFWIGAILATLFGHVVLVTLYQLEQLLLKRGKTSRVITALLEGESDSRKIEAFILGLKNVPRRWQAVREGDGLRISMEGRYGRKEVDGLLTTLHGFGTIREVRVRLG